MYYDKTDNREWTQLSQYGVDEQLGDLRVAGVGLDGIVYREEQFVLRLCVEFRQRT